MNVLVIGQAPPRRATAEHKPLTGRAGLRLARAADVTLDRLHELIDTANVFPEFPGRAARKGDAFDGAAAKAAAAAVPIDGRRVIYLGRKVARAFGHRGRIEYMVPLQDQRAQAAWCLPHPSGINRWWNAPGNLTTARTFLRGVLGLDPPEHMEDRR